MQAKSRFVNRPTRTGSKTYDKYFIYVPTDLANDSQFPFKHNDELMLTIKSATHIEIAKLILATGQAGH